MGVIGDLTRKYDDFQQDQIKRRTKMIRVLKQKAALAVEEGKYRKQINESKKSRRSLNNIMFGDNADENLKNRRNELGKWF